MGKADLRELEERITRLEKKMEQAERIINNLANWSNAKVR